MRKRIISTIILVVITISILYTSNIYLNSKQIKPIVLKPTENVYVEILPRVELLSGVLTQTTWMKENGPYTNGNEYFRELEKFFSKYKDHPAIKIAQKLTDRGFYSLFI